MRYINRKLQRKWLYWTLSGAHEQHHNNEIRKIVQTDIVVEMKYYISLKANWFLFCFNFISLFLFLFSFTLKMNEGFNWVDFTSNEAKIKWRNTALNWIRSFLKVLHKKRKCSDSFCFVLFFLFLSKFLWKIRFIDIKKMKTVFANIS